MTLGRHHRTNKELDSILQMMLRMSNLSTFRVLDSKTDLIARTYSYVIIQITNNQINAKSYCIFRNVAKFDHNAWTNAALLRIGILSFNLRLVSVFYVFTKIFYTIYSAMSSCKKESLLNRIISFYLENIPFVHLLLRFIIQGLKLSSCSRQRYCSRKGTRCS